MLQKVQAIGLKWESYAAKKSKEQQALLIMCLLQL